MMIIDRNMKRKESSQCNVRSGSSTKGHVRSGRNVLKTNFSVGVSM